MPSMARARGGVSVPSVLALMVAGLLVPPHVMANRAASAQAPAFPDPEWEAIDDPQSVGYSAEKLDALRHWLEASETTALMVSVGGKSLFEYGDVGLVSKVASVRKSILAMLYGKYVANGAINLNATVKEVGLDDKQRFVEFEERATIEHLITARSGVYLPSGSYEPDRHLPKRGAYYPGTYFYYHNWDFNAAGTAFETLTGLDIYDALEADLVKPVGMQDFDRARQAKAPMEPPQSVHLEYAMYLSTRDMARLGLLMLRGGRWGDEQLLPEGWAQRIASIVTPYRDMNPPFFSLQTRPSRWGYGMMWWVWDPVTRPGPMTGPFAGACTAWGDRGQFITVLPALDMVVAHKINIDEPDHGQVTQLEFQTILQMLIASHCGNDGDDCWQ